MTSFLQTLGDIGSGLAPAISQIADQQQQNQSSGDIGNVISQLYGGQAAPQQTGLGSLLSKIGISPAQLTQQAQPQAPVPQSQPAAQLGPRVAQPGGGIGAQPAPQPQAQGQPQAAPQAPPQQPPPQPQQQPPKPQDQGSSPLHGQLDLPTLAKGLVANGLSGKRLTDALTNPRVIALLNAQGLQQYRDTGLAIKAQMEKDAEANRNWNRDPNAQGSTAQNRVANQKNAVERMEGVADRSKARAEAALAKLRDAKTDKEAATAKRDLSKVASDLKAELSSELNIASAPGTPPEEQKAAQAKATEIRQQLEDATNEAVKARRTGPANGDQVGGAKGPQKAAPEVVQGKPVHEVGEVREFNGKPYHYTGGDWDAQESWAPGQ